jgi:hypothetical protein
MEMGKSIGALMMRVMKNYAPASATRALCELEAMGLGWLLAGCTPPGEGLLVIAAELEAVRPRRLRAVGPAV